MVDWVNVFAQHWNDILTVLTFLVTATLGYRQYQDLNRKRGEIILNTINDSRFRLIDSQRDPEITGTMFTLDALLSNKGRETSYIMDISGTVEKTGEKLQFTSRSHEDDQGRIMLGETERRDVHLISKTTHSYTNTDYIKVELRFDSSTGNITKTVDFNMADDEW